MNSVLERFWSSCAGLPVLYAGDFESFGGGGFHFLLLVVMNCHLLEGRDNLDIVVQLRVVRTLQVVRDQVTLLSSFSVRLLIHAKKLEQLKGPMVDCYIKIEGRTLGKTYCFMVPMSGKRIAPTSK